MVKLRSKAELLLPWAHKDSGLIYCDIIHMQINLNDMKYKLGKISYSENYNGRELKRNTIESSI